MCNEVMTEEQKKFCEKLFTDNYKLLYKRIYELLKNIDPSSAEDCLGNVFLTLCLSAEKVMNHENPTAWIFLTARFICLKHIRNIGNVTKRNIPIDEQLSNSISDGTDMEDKIINDIIFCQWKNQGMKEKLIDDLNDNEKEIIKMKFEKGFSNKEIGEILGKSEDAIRFTIYYVKKKITEKIYSL